MDDTGDARPPRIGDLIAGYSSRYEIKGINGGYEIRAKNKRGRPFGHPRTARDLWELAGMLEAGEADDGD